MKIIKDKTHNVWLTSDTHFSHKNICRGVTQWDTSRANSTRDFNTVKEMNRTLVDNINSVVMQDDTLIHLGDWSFGGVDEIWNFRKQIICKNIILVLGNHDHHIRNNRELPNSFQAQIGRTLFANEVFMWVGDLLELSIIDNTNEGRGGKSPRMDIVCTHYPFASWDELGKGRVHLHGHIHTPKQFILPKVGKLMDIGVDGNDMKPWSFDEIRKIMAKQPIGSLLPHRFDHHTDKNTH